MTPIRESTARDESAFGDSLLSYTATAGVLTGLVEFAFAAPEMGWSNPGSPSLLLALTTALLGLCGFVYGGILLAIRSLCRQPLSRPIRIALVAALWACLVLTYPRAYATTLALLLPLGGILAWRTVSERSLFALLAWIGLLALIRPLFAGQAIVRVFSAVETYGIFIGVVALTGVLSLILFAQPVYWRPRSRVSGLLAVAAALAAVCVLCAASSVFMVRLWGFNTMEYLQVTLIVLKIACLSVPLTILGVSLLGWMHRPARERDLMLFGILFAIVAAAGQWGLRSDATARFLLPRLPDSQLLVEAMAGWVDYDRDSYSPLFGFGDCDDARADIHPRAVDVPGNGLDENCLGGDLASIRHPYFNLPLQIEPVPRTPGNGRPKVAVLLVVDTLRADVAHDAEKTPGLARIAQSSVDFRNAYSQSNNTLESFPYFLHLGFRNFPRYHVPLTLPEQLRRGGVVSAGLFQSSTEWWSGPLDSVFLGFDQRLFPETPVRNRSIQDTTQLVIDELTRPVETDRFLMVHFESLHNFATEVMEGDRLINQGVNVSELIGLMQIEGFVAMLRGRYMRALGEIDQALLRIWEQLRELEKSADVMLVLTSDHGEEFYEHRGLFHLGTLYEELVRVPLLVYRTGVEPRMESQPVGLYRIPSTLLGFFGYQGVLADQLDLLAQPLKPYEVFGYFSTRAEWARRNFMVMEGGRKLIYNEAQNGLELYDLEADPGEQYNAIDDPRYAAVREELIGKLDTVLFFMNYGDMPPPPDTEMARAQTEIE